MDKTWINLPTLDPKYVQGVKEFINFAFENNSKSNEVACPCKKCRNVRLVTKLTLGQHLIMNRFLPSYTRWIFHREDSSSSMPSNETNDSRSKDEMHDLVYDAFGVPPPSLIHLESDEGKLSKKNRRIRREKKLHHRTGRKPFSVVRHEETIKNNGVPISRPQVWMATYLKDGMSSSDSVAEVMTQMKGLAAQMEGSSTESTTITEEVFTQVMGPELPGRVRTFGLGVTPTDVFGSRYKLSEEQTNVFQSQLQEQFQQYQVQLELKMKEMMEKQLEMQSTIQAQQSTLQSQQARMEYLESQLQAIGGANGPVVAPSNALHTRQVTDASSSHHIAAKDQPVPHQLQFRAFTSSVDSQSKKGKTKKKKLKKKLKKM